MYKFMALQVTFTISSQWSTGCQGTISIKNTSSAVVSNWSVSFTPTNFSLGGVGDFLMTGGQKGVATILVATSWVPKSLNPGQVVSSSFNASGSFTTLALTDTDPRAEYVGDVQVTIAEPTTTVPVPVPTPVPASSAIVTVSGKRNIVYYPNYAVYERKYFPTDIQCEYITDIILAFMCPNPNRKDYNVLTSGWDFPIPAPNYATYEPPLKPELALVHHDEWADMGVAIPNSTKTGVIPSLVELKTKYPHLKIHIADGGWSLSWIFSKMSDAKLRKNHVDSIVTFMLENNIDGYNLDWEYPGRQGIGYNYVNYGGVADKVTLDNFVQELRAAMDLASPTKRLELSVTFGADPVVIGQHKDCAKYMDWAGVMTYDFSGAWTTQMSFHSGVYIDPIDKSLPLGFCGADAVANTLALGIAPGKVMFGVPTYARGWKCDPMQTIFGTATGAANSLDSYGEPGNTSWKSVNDKLKLSQFVDNTRGSVMAAWGKDNLGQLWTYDNTKTVEMKCDFMQAMGLGGVMFWDLVSDVRDLSSPDSLIGTATRRMNANKGLSLTATPGSTTPYTLPDSTESVPTGGASGIITAPTPTPVPVPTPTPVPVPTPTPVPVNNGGTANIADGLKCISVVIVNDGAAPITIQPGQQVVFNIGALLD